MKKANNQNHDSRPYDEEFLNDLKPCSLVEAKKRLELFFYEQDNETDGGNKLSMPWHKDFTAPWCPVLISDPGCGKSIIIESTAMERDWEYRRIPMGDVMEEDNMGVIDPNHQDDKGHHTFTMPACMPMDPPCGGLQGGRGIAHFDEIGTGSPTHQNMVSILLTAGYRTGVFGHTIHRGWFLCASMNPETAKYHLNQQLDPRVRDRLFPIYVVSKPEEVIYYLGQSYKIPEFIYGFMMMNKDMAFEGVSPRSWEMIGALGWRYHHANTLQRHEFVDLLRSKLPKGTVEALSAYMQLGDDPIHYPVSGRAIMNADESEHKEHMSRMKKWHRAGNDSLISATAYDISQYLGDRDQVLADKQVKNIAEVIEHIVKADLVQQIVDISSGTDNAQTLIKHIKNNPDSRIAKSLAAMMDRANKHRREEGM